PALGRDDPALGDHDPAPDDREPAQGDEDLALGRYDAALSNDDPALGGHDPALGDDDPSLGRDDPALGGHDPALGGHAPAAPSPLTGTWYTLARFGDLQLGVGYYIDSLTIAMFLMVGFVATCIHVYSFGYMHEELHDFHDGEVRGSDGAPLVRPGRFHRFFQFMSLFCFSMLGLAVSGNLFMVFAFWELVGVCSYFLIGFYVERRSACTAANKAFIVNRVGDFGMVSGLMILLGTLGTLDFGDVPGPRGEVRPGMFSLVRSEAADHALTVPEGMRRFAGRSARSAETAGEPAAAAETPSLRAATVVPSEPSEEQGGPRRGVPLGYTLGYMWLTLAGLGVFCGCVGKSAQFPLHVWLPDAMEGPTPVSALIHAATMVAAGVYLVGRCYPLFTPEVLYVVAVIGTVTLLMAAAIALTATDIKRVLAYSTVSQLGYMMLALGVGGWVAGLFHLLTHAFFKSLLFLCSGSVIHACGTNEMPRMGGLGRKMPWTAGTMLVGCLAISGVGIPLSFGLSGFHSKDAIIAQALLFQRTNPMYGWVFYAAVLGAAVTAFYMFRLWFMTFTGRPRDERVFAHAHESPPSMLVPLVVLAIMAIAAGWPVPGTALSIPNILEQGRPAGTGEEAFAGAAWAALTVPPEHESHQAAVHVAASWAAFAAAALGIALAVVFYGTRNLDPGRVVAALRPVYVFLKNGCYFDELYDRLWVRPTLFLAGCAAWVDRRVIDRLADGSAAAVRGLAVWDDVFDRLFVDRAVNGLAEATYRLGLSLRRVQTGRIRLYIVWLAAGTAALFVLASLYWGFLTT
ncbi:MAG: NADH-quinone oxidoreductase subunit L, partial [Thermogutta sp.]|nr:NADH-quinone oxidoreductase subunit L [Thermogutta sp.]